MADMVRARAARPAPTAFMGRTMATGRATRALACAAEAVGTWQRTTEVCMMTMMMCGLAGCWRECRRPRRSGGEEWI